VLPWTRSNFRHGCGRITFLSENGRAGGEQFGDTLLAALTFRQNRRGGPCLT
jgi:hypothetical protein